MTIRDELENAIKTHTGQTHVVKMLSAALASGSEAAARLALEHLSVKPLHEQWDYPRREFTSFWCGLSDAFKDKENLTGEKRAFGFSFYPYEVTTQKLHDHIRQGRAWTPGAFRDNRRIKKNFVSSQLLALDFDNGTSIDECLSDGFIRHFAAILHASPSSTPEQPKTRVIFVLDTPVMIGSRWEALQRGLLNHYTTWQPDPKCKDMSRLYFGSTNGTPEFMPDNVLPLGVASALCQYEAYEDKWRKDAPAKPVPTFETPEKAKRYVEKAIDSELHNLQTTPKGSRNTQLFKSGCNLFGMARGGWGVSDGYIEAELRKLGRHIGLSDHEINATIESASRNAAPRELHIG